MRPLPVQQEEVHRDLGDDQVENVHNLESDEDFEHPSQRIRLLFREKSKMSPFGCGKFPYLESEDCHHVIFDDHFLLRTGQDDVEKRLVLEEDEPENDP